jgi:thiol-disulfide isomerase/thioredoxin
MKLLFVVFLIMLVQHSKAQVVDSAKLPPYLKTRQLPSFKFLKLDSVTYLYKQSLTPKKPTIFIVFNPDCSHCITETKRIVDSIKYLSKAQLVFLSIASLPEIKKFAAFYKLDSLKNVIVCQDKQNYFGYFYRLKRVPFVALYNRKNELDTVYESDSYVKQLFDRIKLMK